MKSIGSPKKRYYEFSKLWQSLEILNVFYTLTFEINFIKQDATQHFHTKLSYQKPLLKQIECGVQNGPFKKNGTLSATTFFENFIKNLP